ncbi:unnamed protein product, partial [marine sediment metagenome]
TNLPINIPLVYSIAYNEQRIFLNLKNVCTNQIKSSKLKTKNHNSKLKTFSLNTKF